MVRSNDSHFKLVSGASFSTEGVLECNIIAHRRSWALLCMLRKIMCNPMHSLYGAPQTSNMPELHGWLHAVPWLHIGILMPLLAVDRIPLSINVELLDEPVFDGVGLSDFKYRANAFVWPKRLPHFLSLIGKGIKVLSLYPEWPHRQCVGLVFRRSQVRTSLRAVSLVICCPARIAVCIRGAQGVLPCVGWGVQPVNWIYRL